MRYIRLYITSLPNIIFFQIPSPAVTRRLRSSSASRWIPSTRSWASSAGAIGSSPPDTAMRTGRPVSGSIRRGVRRGASTSAPPPSSRTCRGASRTGWAGWGAWRRRAEGAPSCCASGPTAGGGGREREGDSGGRESEIAARELVPSVWLVLWGPKCMLSF